MVLLRRLVFGRKPCVLVCFKIANVVNIGVFLMDGGVFRVFVCLFVCFFTRERCLMEC